MLAIGKALGLHPILMEILLEKAGFSNKYDYASVVLKYLIWNQQDETIEEWQKTIDEAHLNIKLPVRKEK